MLLIEMEYANGKLRTLRTNVMKLRYQNSMRSVVTKGASLNNDVGSKFRNTLIEDFFQAKNI